MKPPSRSYSSSTRAAMAFSAPRLASFGSASAASTFVRSLRAAQSSSTTSNSLLPASSIQPFRCSDFPIIAASAMRLTCASCEITVSTDEGSRLDCGSTHSVARPVAARSASAVRSTARRSLRNPIRCFDQAVMAAAAFRFLRQPSRPNAPMTICGDAATGKGML
jgi:hypothetical protein